MALFGRAATNPVGAPSFAAFALSSRVIASSLLSWRYPPQMGRRRSGSQKSVEIRTVSSLVEFYVRAARPSRALPAVAEAPSSRVLSVTAPG